ncbi:MAG: hypothetical protein EPN38_02335 [Rhodanobacteraceae bacterium]|nr:MAG: hypothetical protein EPN38_02335 [Rhodanobacteraceae bacterium]
MKIRISLTLALALGAALAAASAGHAQALPTMTGAPASAPSPLQLIPDPELSAMRGRFMLGNSTVAYFGVSMTSSWITTSGQALNGGVTLGMNFSDGGTGAPQITFTPTMNIVRGTPALPGNADTATRSVDGAGLANVNGLMQGIQVAGDGNRARNVTALKVTHGQAGPAANHSTANSAPFATQLSADDAQVAITFDPARGLSLSLGVKDQGLVSQWIRSGSVGQLVQLTADGQSVQNQLQLDLVLNDAGLRNPALQDASRALLQSRGLGAGGY